MRKHPYHEPLTPREVEILQSFADCNSTYETAAMMHISHQTVQSHVKNILAKLGVRSKLEAVMFGIRRGFIEVARDREEMAS